MAKITSGLIDQYWHMGGLFGLISRTSLRTLQFIFAVIVAGLYGVDLAHDTRTNTHAPAEWVYAEVVCCLSAITCIIHCFVTVTRVCWSAWDGVLFILWLAQVGVFGTIYGSSVKPGYENATQSLLRMHAAIWISLVNMLMWFATTILAITWCIRARKVTRRTDLLDVNKEQESEMDKDLEIGEVKYGGFEGSELDKSIDRETCGDAIKRNEKGIVNNIDKVYLKRVTIG